MASLPEKKIRNKIMRRRIRFLLMGLLILPTFMCAQLGKGVVDFPLQTRSVALGGRNISSPLFSFQNPALGSLLGSQVGLSYLNYYADIRAGQLQGNIPFGPGNLGIQARYISFGSMEGYDELGNYTGSFTAQESILTLGYAHKIEGFSLGIALKPLLATVQHHQSLAFLVDVGTTFSSPQKNIVLAAVIKNLGLESTWRGNWYLYPLDLWAGLSLKPEDLPFQFSFTSHDWLQDLGSYYEAESPVKDHTMPLSMAARFLNKWVLGIEYFLQDMLIFSVGWNQGQRYTLRLDELSRGVGLSYGVQFSYQEWRLGMARAHHTIRGGHFQFSLGMNLPSSLNTDS
ncbi:MAG: PorV/PorQ family protein [Cytophagales bacterium]|nr:PorV/PorQ family protein [Cytophagales bacterium]